MLDDPSQSPHFDLNSAVLRPRGRVILERLAQCMLRGPLASKRVEHRRFVFFSRGSVFATGGPLVTSVALKLYVIHFGNYEAIYGSLGAIIVLLMWLFAAGWMSLLGPENG